MLVNNVGMTLGSIERYADVKEEKKIRDLINWNIMSMARMCRLALPKMINRRSGVIINLESQLGIMSSPMETLYGASKVRYNLIGNKSLRIQLKIKFHIHIFYRPLLTNFHGIYRSKWKLSEWQSKFCTLHSPYPKSNTCSRRRQYWYLIRRLMWLHL